MNRQRRNERRTSTGRRRMAEAKSLLGGQCVICGIIEDLEFDHIDPSTKLFTISTGATEVSEQRFRQEIAKCQLLCRPHHEEKTIKDGPWARGQSSGRSKLRELDVKYIFGLAHLGHTQRAIAEEFGVTHTTVGCILRGETWTHIYSPHRK